MMLKGGDGLGWGVVPCLKKAWNRGFMKKGRTDLLEWARLLKECRARHGLARGKRIHASLLSSRPTLLLGNTLLHMYAKCGTLAQVRALFLRMPRRNVFSWTITILAHANAGFPLDSLLLFWKMPVAPDTVACVCVLKACSSLASPELGKQTHESVRKHGLESDPFVGAALVDMYVKCGCVEDARSVFDRMRRRSVVAWNSMLAGYAQHGHEKTGLLLFERMRLEGVPSDKVTFTCALKVAANLAALEHGKQAHAGAESNGCEQDVLLRSALVHMYAKCGRVQDAREVFERMPQRNAVSWSAMITGYAQHGHGAKAFAMFERMQKEGRSKPDEVIFSSALKACADLAALKHGKLTHACIEKSLLVEPSDDSMLEKNPQQRVAAEFFVGSALIHMYSECGSLGYARRVFDRMRRRNVVAWNAMVAGYAHHGHGRAALELLEEMRREGVKPDETTFLSLLSACSYKGLVNEAAQVFNSMSRDFGISPTEEHYTCMVDLLGRSGHVVEAEDLINKMPFQPTAAILRALLSACRMHGNIEIGRHLEVTSQT